MNETLTTNQAIVPVKEKKQYDKKEQVKPDYASSKDLETIVNVVSGLAESIEKLNEKIDNKPKEQEMKDRFEEKSGVHIKPDDASGGHIPPKWREIVNNTLGSDFQIKVVYPEKGSGFLFKIIVPESKSNMTED